MSVKNAALRQSRLDRESLDIRGQSSGFRAGEAALSNKSQT